MILCIAIKFIKTCFIKFIISSKGYHLRRQFKYVDIFFKFQTIILEDNFSLVRRKTSNNSKFSPDSKYT